jgi:hypothetical protein
VAERPQCLRILKLVLLLQLKLLQLFVKASHVWVRGLGEVSQETLQRKRKSVKKTTMPEFVLPSVELVVVLPKMISSGRFKVSMPKPVLKR